MSDRHGYYVLDENGEPVLEPDHMTWALWFGKTDRQIARDVIDDVVVSTIYWGTDIGTRDDPPLLWESKVTLPSGNYKTLRFPSRDAALLYHQRVIDFLRGGGSLTKLWGRELAESRRIGDLCRELCQAQAKGDHVAEERVTEAMAEIIALRELVETGKDSPFPLLDESLSEVSRLDRLED